MKMAAIIHGALLLVGSILLVLGVQLFLSSRKFLENGIKTSATVIDQVETMSRDSNGTSLMYAPKLEYDVKGEKITYVPNARANPPAYHIGEKVEIVYKPNNYRDVRITLIGVFISEVLFCLP